MKPEPVARAAAPVVVFLNCYEEMATGMRILAQIALDAGYDARVIVLHGFRDIPLNVSSLGDSSDMHLLVNGRLRITAYALAPVSAREFDLLQDEIRALKPAMLCVSSRSRNDWLMPELLRRVRDAAPGAPLICGGYGPSYAPEHYLRHGADIVIRGEGEEAMRELLRLHGRGLPLDSAPNACFLRGGAMLSNPLRPLLRDLGPRVSPSPLVGSDRVVFIDDNAVSRRDPAYDGKKNFPVLLGRGCIERCAYCAAPVQGRMYREQGLHAPRYRRREHEQVLRELEDAKAQGVESIFFKDEYIADRPERLMEFFAAYAARIALPFKGHFRHEHLLRHAELRRALRDAGWASWTAGFQAGNEAMAREVYGRRHSFDDLLALSHILHDEGLALQFHFISGTSLNGEAEFADKCALIRQLPYDAAFPWRTLLFDFQFYPQPLSSMTRDFQDGRLRRLATAAWAEKALLAQLHQGAPPLDAIHEAGLEARRLDGAERLEYLQNACQRLRAARKEHAFKEAARSLAGRDIFVMGEATAAYAQWKDLFEASRIVGRVAFPGVHEDEAGAAGRIALPRLADRENAPLVVFGDSAARVTALRGRHGIKNALVCVSSHA